MTRQIIIAIPPTTDYTIVFPHDDFGKRFDSGFYSPALTDGRASLEEINQILAEVEIIRRPLAGKMCGALCCYIVSIIASVVAYVLFMVSMINNNSGLFPFLIAGFIGMIILIFWVFIVRVKNIHENIRKKCKEVIDKHNHNFVSRGLRWHLPIQFPRWIELWKDYRAASNSHAIYMPPVSQHPYPPISHNYGAPNQNMNMGGQPQFQQNYYQNHQGAQNNMYIPPSQV